MIGYCSFIPRKFEPEVGTFRLGVNMVGGTMHHGPLAVPVSMPSSPRSRLVS